MSTDAPGFLEKAEELPLQSNDELPRHDVSKLTVIWSWKFSNIGRERGRGERRISNSGNFNIQTPRNSVPTPVRSFRIKFNVSCAADLSGVMGTLIFLMSSDAVGEINFASFRPGFISTRLEIHWKNKRHDKRERKKKAGEWKKKREGRARWSDRWWQDESQTVPSCKSINGSFTRVTHRTFLRVYFI